MRLSSHLSIQPKSKSKDAEVIADHSGSEVWNGSRVVWRSDLQTKRKRQSKESLGKITKHAARPAFALAILIRFLYDESCWNLYYHALTGH